MSDIQTLATWVLATSVRAAQLGIDLSEIADVETRLALFFISVALATVAVDLFHLIEGES